MKYLGINLTKEVKNLYVENYKMLIKQTEDDSKKWKDIPWSWFRRINIVFFSCSCSTWVIYIIASSRSVMLSSVSPSLLLMPSMMFFISLIVIFSLDWFFFIFSSSLIKCWLCYLLFSLILLLFLLFMFGKYFSGKLVISVLLVVISGVSLVLSNETYSSVFSFSLTFFVSLKLGEAVTYYGLEGVFFCGSSLTQSACTQ